MSKYPNYKDSNVEWLGEIPKHWTITLLKRYCNVTDGSHHSPSIQDEGFPFISVTDVGHNSINFNDCKKISEEDFNRLIREGCKPNIGDVLLTKDGTIGRAAIIKKEYPIFVILSSLGLLSPNSKLNNHYLYYYLISGLNIDQMNSMIHGSALKRMTISKIDNLVISFPDYTEQQTIANYLNKATAKIDTLIGKQTKLIELLKEKRQAVISTAVTRGLDSTVTMKDSGVEWLGEIPKHWARKKLNDVAEQYKNSFVDGPFGSDLKSNEYKTSGIPLIQLNNIKDGIHLLKNMKFITEEKKEQLSRHIARQGDVVIAKMAEPVARATIVNPQYGEYVIVADCVRLTPKSSEINTSFLIYAINSKPVRTGAELVSTGTTRIRVNLTELKKLWIPYPELQEQEDIAKFLDDKTSKIDNLTTKATKAIDLLKEKRTALISSAVTGKIDVREIA